MKIAMLCDMCSPHMLPLANEMFNKVGNDSFRYYYLNGVQNNTRKFRSQMGWKDNEFPSWCFFTSKNYDSFLYNADVLITEIRATDLIRHRLRNRKLTFYTSERWLKPRIGIFRIFFPRYFRLFIDYFFCLKDEHFYYLADGIYAAKDIIRIISLLSGNLKCFFRTPTLAFESHPLGSVFSLNDAKANALIASHAVSSGKQLGFIPIQRDKWMKSTPQGIYSKIKMWGYFVAGNGKHESNPELLVPSKVLWIGRMLKWKEVDTIIKACGESNLQLNLYGHGEQESKLRSIASKYSNIHFHDYVPIERVRQIMNENDTYVLSSNGYEGWGAVVSEALEENMIVLSSKETGAGATLLSAENLFSAGNVRELKELLSKPHCRGTIGEWNAHYAAEALMSFIHKGIGHP